MIWNCVVLLFGFALLLKGADAFVDGSSGIARLLRVPGVVIGLTIVAIGTSLPEASVSITAGLVGANGLSLGNVIGSNIFNLMVVACLCALIMTFSLEKQLLTRDFPVCVGASVLLVVFLLDGVLARWEGLVLLAGIIAYIAWTVAATLKNRAGTEPCTETISPVKCVVFIAVSYTHLLCRCPPGPFPSSFWRRPARWRGSLTS